MKVIDETEDNEVFFKSINIGNAFKSKVTNRLYIKIPPCNDLANDFFNCVHLETGKFSRFTDNERVLRVNAEITVR